MAYLRHIASLPVTEVNKGPWAGPPRVKVYPMSFDPLTGEDRSAPPSSTNWWGTIADAVMAAAEGAVG